MKNTNTHIQGFFPGSSDGKESACNAGDQGLIPGQPTPAGRIPWTKEPGGLQFMGLQSQT